MTAELIVSPRDESVRVALAEARDWGAYVTELRGVILEVIEKSGANVLEVSELLVGQPLPKRHSGIRNGLEVDPPEAMDLIVGMAAGFGPYCRLTATSRLRVESGWDGVVHLYVTPEVADDLVDLRGGGLSGLEWRIATPEPADVARPVETAVGDEFWSAVQAAAGKVTLLRERWAYGAYGCTWFRVTSRNVREIAQVVRPRSLLGVVVDPDLRLRSDILEDDFTAFEAPLNPGELVYRSYLGGAESIEEVVGNGFSLMLSDSVLAEWCAVVPDPDGVIRGCWAVKPNCS